MYPIAYKSALTYGKHFSGASGVGEKTGLRSEKPHWDTLWCNF